MELKKRKYARRDVEKLLNAEKTEYDKLIFSEKSKNLELSEENLRLSQELDSIKNKEKQIVETLERTEKGFDEMNKQVNLAYAMELARIKSFSSRWNLYFNEIYKKYPLDKDVKAAYDLTCKGLNLEQSEENKKTIDSINKIFDDIDDQHFNPKKKIMEYLASTGDNGFNMDEVLNPGNLELGDLCKELGLMDEKE